MTSKIARGELSTAKGRRTWTDAQDLHFVPQFGDQYLDAIKRRDLEDWKTTLALQVRAGKLSPHTVNARLRVLLSTQPNALSVEEVPAFMSAAHALFPQHYAQLALGLMTGRRRAPAIALEG